uniref:DUF4708 domain-containing protein n=1 Tax=Poecilia latipinna TaxID=48699 RepID=A0A3B3VH02_9TELE
MSGVGPKSLFFFGLPDLTQLVCVTLSPLEEEQQEPRTNQIKTCRQLVLLYSDILACPALDSITDVTALGGLHTPFPGDLQCCLSYSLISRLAPSWNKAGLYLISGRQTDGSGSGSGLELSTSGGRLCLSIEASGSNPAFLCGSDLSGRCNLASGHQVEPLLCVFLCSMKKGQIISISRQLPRDGPFRTYGDLQSHWNRLYGYRLPDLQGGEVYCSVYFRPVGEKLFTYPLSCIRLQPVQRCPRGDLQGALARFLADSRERLQSVCGFPTRLTSKPSYPMADLNFQMMKVNRFLPQVLSSDQINLTTRPVLSQPAPSSRPDPPAWVPLSQQGGALPGSRSGNSLWHRPEDRSPSARSPSARSPSARSLSARLSSSQNQQQSDHSLFVSSFFQHFQPASSLPPLPQPSPVPVNPPPKLVPIFRNNDPTRRLSVALLRVQKQQSGGTGDKRRLTLPLPVGSQTTPSSSSSSVPPPPLIVPRFARRPKSRSAAVPQPSGQSRVTRISSLSPVFKARAAIIIPPSRTSGTVRPERAADCLKAARPKSIMKTSREAGPEGSTEPEPAPPHTETAASSRKVGPLSSGSGSGWNLMASRC